MPLYRPEPILTPTGDPADPRVHHAISARALIAGKVLRVHDRYRTGKGILKELVATLRPPLDTADHADKQAYRTAYRAAAWRLLVPVKGGKIDLPDAPHIGFLAELYPELPSYWLPMPELRDLSNAWHHYTQGVHLPVLGHSLHPFYGAYLPTRTEHLELFATWLSGWKGCKDHAVDVGTGSGVLALLLAKAGFKAITATDSNANAVESAQREVARRPEPPPITVHEADLLDLPTPPADLIVFNPPWTSGPVNNLLDRALHHDGDALLQRFFDQAYDRLTPDGRVAIVYSNIRRLVQPDLPHPIEEELAKGRFTLVQTARRRVKPPKGSSRRTKERVEVWELARAQG